MTCLRVDIVAFADESFPGFVRCAFADADGNRHTFIEKIPVVSTQELWTDSNYPQPGMVPCMIVEKYGMILAALLLASRFAPSTYLTTRNSSCLSHNYRMVGRT